MRLISEAENWFSCISSHITRFILTSTQNETNPATQKCLPGENKLNFYILFSFRNKISIKVSSSDCFSFLIAQIEEHTYTYTSFVSLQRLHLINLNILQ